MAETEPEPQVEQDVAHQEGAELPDNPAPHAGEREAAQDQHQREGDDPAKLRREAASYRRKLREAEGTNERLAERVAEMQRSAIERDVSGAGKLADGSDIWLTGTKLEELLAEDGAIDAEKVKAKLEEVLAEHPAWRDRTHGGLGGGARGTQPSAPSFGEALKNPSLRRSSR